MKKEFRQNDFNILKFLNNYISARSMGQIIFSEVVHHSTQMKSLQITDCTILCAMNGTTIKIASSNVTETAFAIAVI